MKRLIILSLLMTFTATTLVAKVELPYVISDNMVLQQKTNVALWGKTKPKKKVIITTTWAKGKTVVKADESGKWLVKVATPEAGGPYEITFNDGDKVTLKNILIGEVWICSGQSNMEMKMRGFAGQPIEGATDIIINADPSTQIRMCNLKMTRSLELQENCETQWLEHTPEGVRETSAVAYFFAKRLHETLGIPVGVINASWGGTPIEAWMDRELLEKEFAEDINLDHYKNNEFPKSRPHRAAGVLYNGMLHSLVPYTNKGFIWYQGCDGDNRLKPELYKKLQPAFVKMLREKWDNEKMPFYFTQIAPYGYNDKHPRTAGFMMWAQAQTLDLIPYSGMAATHDVGEVACIHPRNKKAVGDRLAFLALANDYGRDQIDLKTPIAREFKTEGNEMLVTFEVGKAGLSPINLDIEGFELAGADGVFYPATARVISKQVNTIKVTSPAVTSPKYVRYGLVNTSKATLFNCFGIPVSPFRNDTFAE